MGFLICTALSVKLGGHEPLAGFEMELAEGEYLTLVGPSGCGKTTLLRAIAGLVEPRTGRIALGEKVLWDGDAGVNLPPYHRGVGMAFQHQALWPHLSAEKTLRFVLRRALGLRGKALRERARELLAQVRIDHLARRLPGTMSGGERQRLSIARALANDPRVLLLDEPLGPLDAHLRREIAALIHELHTTHGLTTVHVTHDQEEAFRLGERVAVMRAGAIEQIGAAAELRSAPKSAFVASFLEGESS